MISTPTMIHCIYVIRKIKLVDWWEFVWKCDAKVYMYIMILNDASYNITFKVEFSLLL